MYRRQSLLLRRNVGSRSPIIRGRIGRAAAGRPTRRLGAKAGTAQRLRGLAERSSPGCRPLVVAHDEGSGNRSDPIATTKRPTKGYATTGSLKQSVIESRPMPLAGAVRPSLYTARLVEPSVHGLELPAKPLAARRNPHAYRIMRLRLALDRHPCSRHVHVLHRDHDSLHERSVERHRASPT